MNNSNKIKNVISAIGIILFVVIVVFAIVLFTQSNEDADASTSETESTTEDEDTAYRSITYNGEEYEFNDSITTILFMGIDQTESVEVDGEEWNSGRSDTLILLIINEDDNSLTMLNISRDTMVDVDIYDAEGNFYSTTTSQITMQYAYGDGEEQSCRLTRDAVSDLLYDIPIDYYLSMNMDGIEAVTELLGGVTVTIPDDYTYIDSSFEEGATVTLDGEMAELFVRYRDTDETGSNDDRIERQEVFMEALIEQLQAKMAETSSFYTKLFANTQDYIIMDLDDDIIDQLSECELSDDVYTVPGETVEGDSHDEYIVDTDALEEMLVGLFYNLK